MASTAETFAMGSRVAAEAPPRPARLDPRLYQIGALAGLLTYGLLALDLEVRPARAALILTVVLAAQYAASRMYGLAAFDPRSVLISGLSLCLLLRTSSEAVAVAAALLAVFGKFLLRVRGKHVWNPTNLAVALAVWSGQAWVSPGQWGSAAFFGFLLACLGGLVVNRAARSDVTLAFLVAYGALVVGRSLWLGEPMAIPLHRLQNGALLIFAFFMISDPRTTPDSRAGRILFAGLVALGAAYVQFRLFRTNGLIWSLFVLSPIVPILDLFLPGARYQWAAAPSRRSS